MTGSLERPLHWPQLSRHDFGVVRSPGPGLGNLLFPIARALIGRERHGGVFVYPTMRQLKLGTYLRREPDKRTYGNVIRPRSAEEWRWWLRAQRSLKISEDDLVDGIEGITVTYGGMRNYFHDLVGHRELISTWLAANVRRRGAIDRPFDIGVHVRLGDFRPEGSSRSGFSVRQPIAWYLAAIERARVLIAERKPRIIVFTDCNPNKVARALGLQDIEIDPSHNALVAIMNLSKSRVLVTSRSSFSMWAVYLGDMPAFWAAEFDLAKSFPLRPELDRFI